MAATTQTKPLPSEVRKRLGQLMPLLSSSNAGECAAAAGAIGRLLKGHGLDWHDLTAAVSEPPQQAYSKPEPPPRREPPPPPPPTGHNLAPEEVRTLVLAILKHHRGLNERSRGFLEGQLERAKYGRVLFSDKQWKWLMDLTVQAGVA